MKLLTAVLFLASLAAQTGELGAAFPEQLLSGAKWQASAPLRSRLGCGH
jgi:hypothetical protein